MYSHHSKVKNNKDCFLIEFLHLHYPCLVSKPFNSVSLQSKTNKTKRLLCWWLCYDLCLEAWSAGMVAWSHQKVAMVLPVRAHRAQAEP